MGVKHIPMNDGSTRSVQEPDFSKFPELETRHPDDILDEVVITRADYNSPATLEYRRKTRVVLDSAGWTGRDTITPDELALGYGGSPQRLVVTSNMQWYGVGFLTIIWLTFTVIALGGLLAYTVRW